MYTVHSSFTLGRQRHLSWSKQISPHYSGFFFEISNKRFITVGSITIGCIFKLLMKNIQKNIMHILEISLLIYKKLPPCASLHHRIIQILL